MGDKVEHGSDQGRGKKIKIRSCCVSTCSNSTANQEEKKNSVNFFIFPSDPVRYRQWAKIIGQPDLKTSHKTLRICSEHFKKEDFSRDYSEVVPELYGPNWKKRLVKNAAPSLLLPPSAPSSSVLCSDNNDIIVQALMTTTEKENSSGGDCSSLGETATLPHSSEDCTNSSAPISASVVRSQVTNEIEATNISLVLEPCLVCSHLEDARTNQSLHELPGSEGSQSLNQQLWYTYVLQDLLKLPRWKYEDLLKKAGINPCDWFVICTSCTESVNNMLKIQDQIDSLKKSLRKMKKTFKEKCVNNVSEHCDGAEKAVLKNNEILNIRQEIWICLKDPTVLPRLEPKTESWNDETNFTSIQSFETFSDRDNFLDDDREDGNDRYCDSSDVEMSENENEDKRNKMKNSSPDEEWLPSSTIKSKRKKGTTQILQDPLGGNNNLDVDDQSSDGDSIDSNKPRKRKQIKLSIAARKKKQRDIIWECHICTKTFVTERFLEKHFTLHHHMKIGTQLVQNQEESKNVCELIYNCKVCPRIYSSKTLFERHNRRHQLSKKVYQNRFDCHRCQAPYATVKSLKFHLQAVHRLTLDMDWDEKSPLENHISKLTTRVSIEHDSNEQQSETEVGNTIYDSTNEACEVVRKCERCSSTFPNENSYEKHIKLHKNTPDNLHCPECQRPYANADTLRRHIRSVHKISEFSCEKCGYVAKTYTVLKTHMTNHLLFDNSVDPTISTTHFVCNICKELCRTRRKLSLHRIRTHAEELGMEAFYCTEPGCKSVFLRKNNLIDHIGFKHKKALKFQCDVCGFGAGTKGQIDSHMQRHRAQPLLCTFCGAQYLYKSGLREHMRKIHPEHFESKKVNFTGGVEVEKLPQEYGFEHLPLGNFGVKQPDKEYPCKYCSSIFNHKFHLQTHLKTTHADMYCHNCDLCERVFMSKQSLTLHKKINHNEKDTTVTCGWCLKKVCHKIKLYDHQKYCKKRPTGDNIPKIFFLEDENNQSI